MSVRSREDAEGLREVLETLLKAASESPSIPRPPIPRATLEQVRDSIAKLDAKLPALVAAANVPRSCEHCGGTGWRTATERRTISTREADGTITSEERQVPVVVRCQCPTTEPATVAHVPTTLQAARLTNYVRSLQNNHAVAAVEEWLAGEREHLYFFGETGRGKTRLAITALNEAASRGRRGAFISMPWLMQLLVQSIDDQRCQPVARALMYDALNTHVVVLDDVAGAEKGSDFSRGKLVTLLDRRFNRGLSTIITSNLDLDRLSEFYDDNRIPSRIAGACKETIEIGGFDHRVQQRSGLIRAVK